MKRYLIIDKPQKVEIEGPYTYAVTRIIEELKQDEIECDYTLNSQISIELIDGSLSITANNKNITNYTHIMMRGQFTRRDYEIKKLIIEHIKSYNLSHQLNQIKIQNQQFIETLPHYTKIYQMMVCFQNNIPYLNTYYNTGGKYIENTGSIQYPKILKHYTGKNYYELIEGKLKVKKNVFKIDEVESYNLPPVSKRELSNFFVQEFAPGGQDIRIYMQKDKVVGGWKRTAQNGFLTVAKGSKYEMYNQPSGEITEICIKTVKAFKSDFMAIDLILKDDKPYILEVNMNPGFKAYETKIEGTHTNIARAIIDSF